jgi:hypothetical protein
MVAVLCSGHLESSGRAGHHGVTANRGEFW